MDKTMNDEPDMGGITTLRQGGLIGGSWSSMGQDGMQGGCRHATSISIILGNNKDVYSCDVCTALVWALNGPRIDSMHLF